HSISARDSALLSAGLGRCCCPSPQCSKRSIENPTQIHSRSVRTSQSTLTATMKLGSTTASSQERPGHCPLSGARPAGAFYPRPVSLLRRDAYHSAAPDRVPALFSGPP